MSDSLSELPLLDVALWCYRLFLGRNPENLDVLERQVTDYPSVDALRRRFIRSEEFKLQTSRIKHIALDGSILQAFPAYTGAGVPDFFIDFMGNRTRCSFLPESYAAASGIVEGPPGTERFGLHDPAEWEGTLRSVLEAKERFVAVELGAGWGPWLVAGAKAATQRGIHEIHLAGVEGASSHYEFMLQHFRDNGLDPASHLLLHAIAGEQDGVARFPKLDVPSANWGARASYSEELILDQFEEVQSISVTTLLEKLPVVDLFHCDIQGAENDVLTVARDALKTRVRRIVVGTHSRSIEDKLMEFFGANGWVLEHENSCRFVQNEKGLFYLVADGVQVWRNADLHVEA